MSDMVTLQRERRHVDCVEKSESAREKSRSAREMSVCKRLAARR